MTFKELRCKEVINQKDGCILGYTSDLAFCVESGKIESIMVPEAEKIWQFGNCKTKIIPYCDILRIGPDVVIVNICERKGDKGGHKM